MLAALTILSLAVSEPTHSAELTRVLHPLAPVLGPRSPGSVEVWPVPIDDWLARTEGVQEGADDRRVTAERVEDLVRHVVAPDQWEQPGRSAELVSDFAYLAITAPAEVQAEVRRVLAFLASHLRREIRVRYEAYALRGPTAELEALARDADPRQRLDSLAAAGTLRPVARAVLSLVPGVPARVDRLRDRSFLADYDVEIAQRAGIADPIVRTCTLGLSIAARADVALDGGGIVLQFAARYADDLRAAKQIDATGRTRIAGEVSVQAFPTDIAFLESPNVAFQALAGAASLRPGVSRVAFAAPLGADADDERGLVLAFTLETLGAAERTYGGNSCDFTVRDAGAAWVRNGPQIGSIEPLSASLARSSLAFDGASDALSNALRIDGTAMPDDRAAPLLESALASVAGTLPTDVVTVDHERGFLFTISQAQDSASITDRIVAALPAPLAATFLATAIGPQRRDAVFCIPAAGGEAFVACGFEQTLLIDADVDVAEGASIQNPTVRPVITGRFARLSAPADNGGESLLDLSLVARVRVAGPGGSDETFGSDPQLQRLSQVSTGWREQLRFTRQKGTARIEQALPRAEASPEYLDLEVERIER